MNALFKAIYNLYNTDVGHGAYTSVSGRFYHNVAPQGTPYPYIVYFNVTDLDDLYFAEEMEEFLIQFNVFAEGESDLEAGEIFENVKSLFDNCILTVTDWRHLKFQRKLATPNDDFKQSPPIQGYSIQYDVMLEKQRFYVLDFAVLNGTFAIGDLVTGLTSGATATIVGINYNTYNTGFITIKDIEGTFIHLEQMEVLGETLAGVNFDFEDYVGTQDDGITDAFNGWVVLPGNAPAYIDATATVQSGLNAVKLNHGFMGLTYIYQDIVAIVAAGKFYRLSFWCRGTGGSAQINYAMGGDVDGSIIPGTNTNETGTTYTKYTEDFAVASSNAWVHLEFFNPGVFDAAYVDNIEIIERTGFAQVVGTVHT